MAEPFMTDAQLARLEVVEAKVISISRLILRLQNKDDFGVAVRYLMRLLEQVREDVSHITSSTEQSEASLNLLETRIPS